MKTKDIVQLAVAAVAFSVTGFILFTQLGAKSTLGSTSGGKHPTAEVITPIKPDFDNSALDELTNPQTAQDFTPLIDPNSGLGNSKPFSPQ